MTIVFLDRDGVINQFPGHGEYVTCWENFRFLPSAKEAIALLTSEGFELNVVSNQGGVSRGLMTLEDLHEMTGKMLKEVELSGGKIRGVYYCIHQTSDQCQCKKPKTALFHDAVRGRDILFESAYFIGDSEEDMQAGEKLGCRKILVLSGRTRPGDVGVFYSKPDFIKSDLMEAARWIIQKKF